MSTSAKRKSLSSSGVGERTVTISIDSSRANIQPVLATFASAIPPVASSFATYHHIDNNNKNGDDECLVVSETEKVEYLGQTNDNGQPLLNGSRYLIGVYDKFTGTVTFRKAPLVRVNPVIKSLKDSQGVPDRVDLENQIYKARNELGEAFGNKKRKAQIRADERNRINMDAVKGDMDLIEASMEVRTDSMPTAREQAATDDQSRLVPKYDVNATTADAIYDMEDVLSKAHASHIDVTPFVKAIDPEEYMAKVPARSDFVQRKMEQILDQKKPDLQTLRRVLYLSYLIKFVTINPRLLRKHDACTKALCCTNEIAEVIFDKFAECVAGAVNPDGTPVYTRTTNTESKLMCYISVLMLSLNNWVLYPADMAADLGIPGKKAEKYLQGVGCKLEAADGSQLANKQRPRKKQMGVKKAVLKAPVKFPKPSRRGA